MRFLNLAAMNLAVFSGMLGIFACSQPPSKDHFELAAKKSTYQKLVEAMQKQLQTEMAKQFKGSKLVSASKSNQFDDADRFLFSYLSFKFSGPTQVIHTLFVNLSNENAKIVFTDPPTSDIKTESSAHTRRTTTFAANKGAYLAINGGFWRFGDYWPQGLAMTDGVLWPHPSRGKAYDQPHTGTLMCAENNHCEISPNHSLITRDDAGQWSMLKCGNSATCKEGEDGVEKVELKKNWLNAVDGNVLLVDEGKKGTWDASRENTQLTACGTRAPRTMVGTRTVTIGENKERFLIMTTAAGRNAGGAVGFNYCEMSALMYGLQAKDAMNIDGGGSTTMVINGKTVNPLSDGSERAVPTHIGIVLNKARFGESQRF